MTEWRQERPAWCPHTDCLFRRRAMDAICGGELPTPVPHGPDMNTHRLCLNGAADDGGVFDLQVNGTDLGWFRWIFDQGKETRVETIWEVAQLIALWKQLEKGSLGLRR